MKKSLTEGNPLPLILSFALPLLLGNLFQQTYNMADAAIVGQTLGATALASVGVSSSVQFLVLGFCLGTATGFAIPVANSFGAKNEDRMRQFVFIGGVLTALIALIVTVGTVSLCNAILSFLQTPAEIYHQAHSYLLVIFLGIPCTLLYNYLSAILRAIGDSKTPFMFLAFSSVLNICLDLFCILVLKWGVTGAAIATVFSQGVSGILCLLYIARKFEVLHIHKENMVMEKWMVKKLLGQGLPMGLQFSITAIGSMMMQTANNTLGTIYVSGYAAGLKIKQFAMCPFDALGASISTFLSQNYGAGKPERIKQGIVIGESLAVLYGLVSGLVLILFGRNISMIFLSAQEADALNASGLYLKAIGFFYWALGLLIVTRMSVQGLGYSNLAVVGGFIEMIARSVVSIFIVPLIGYMGICSADQAAWLSAMVYIIPVMLYALNRIRKQFEQEMV